MVKPIDGSSAVGTSTTPQESTDLSAKPKVGGVRMQRGSQPRVDAPQQAWQSFLGKAQQDLNTLQRSAGKRDNAVVILGGGSGNSAGEHADWLDTLGRGLGQSGLPIRVPDRPGDVAHLVRAAVRQNVDLHVEAVDADPVPDLPATVRTQLQTREMRNATLMHGDATAYVMLPGGVDALWELFGLWTLMDVDMIPQRPIVLAGESWRDMLTPLLEAGLEAGTLSQAQIDCLTFTPDLAEAMRVVQQSHAEHKDTHTDSFEKFRADAQLDLTRLPPMLEGFDLAAVGFGSARLRSGSEGYEEAVQYGRELGVPAGSGAGPGIMHALLQGVKESDPAAETQGVNIHLEHEQARNPHVDAKRAAQTETIEVRQRAIIDTASSYAVFTGGSGTWFELAQVWKLMAAGDIPHRPILVSPFYAEFLVRYIKVASAAGLLSEAELDIAHKWICVADDIELAAIKGRAAYRVAHGGKKPERSR